MRGRQSMKNYQGQLISQQTQDLIEKLLLGKFSLTEIAKVTGISEQYLHAYVKEK
jgi:phage portal protein BeeE